MKAAGGREFDVNIGWIGLGMIGSEMVKRLLGAGFAVTVYERGSGLADVKARGASLCSDYASLAAGSDLLAICVYNDAQVHEVLLESGALAGMRAGSVVAIHTTGSPALAREISVRAPAGVSVLDATFSGGPYDIQAGALTLMVGGDADALERAKPAFGAYARNINPMGAVGNGQIVKLLNNLLFATNLMNAAHVLALAEAEQFDPAAVATIIGTCSGASYAMARFEAPLAPAAMLDRVRPYLEKDVAAAMAAAATSGLDVEAFAATARFFQPSRRD
jgi:3-hydroxyisobutyrate dehydrogenase